MSMEDAASAARVAAFLTDTEFRALRVVCRRWYFTSPALQYADGARALPKKSALNLRSRSFQHQWTHFVKAKNQALLTRLVQMLPEQSKEDTYALKMGLCDSTNTGIRPSFDNAHARTGYTIDKINRCGNFPGLLLTPEMSELRSSLFGFSSQRKHWQLALYGGGPGYDAIGMVYLREFLRVDENDVTIHTNVYDNEPGWHGAITSVDAALQSMGHGNASWAFKGCDITEPVEAAINDDARIDTAATDLFVFSFVCVENFLLLRDSSFAFLRSLFASARVGSHFVFMDSTHRLWPVIWTVARETATFRVWVPHVRTCHYVLVLKKLLPHESAAAFPFYEAATDKLATFATHLNQQLEYLGLAQK